MTALQAITRKGRYWIVPHKFGGWHVVDSYAGRPISQTLGNFLTPLAAWKHIQRISA